MFPFWELQPNPVFGAILWKTAPIVTYHIDRVESDSWKPWKPWKCLEFESGLESLENALNLKYLPWKKLLCIPNNDYWQFLNISVHYDRLHILWDQIKFHWNLPMHRKSSSFINLKIEICSICSNFCQINSLVFIFRESSRMGCPKYIWLWYAQHEVYYILILYFLNILTHSFSWFNRKLITRLFLL